MRHVKIMFRNKIILLLAESPCFGKPCKNHGKCTVKGSSFTCTCLQGFKGDKCETLGMFLFSIV